MDTHRARLKGSHEVLYHHLAKDSHLAKLKDSHLAKDSHLYTMWSFTHHIPQTRLCICSRPQFVYLFEGGRNCQKLFKNKSLSLAILFDILCNLWTFSMNSWTTIATLKGDLKQWNDFTLLVNQLPQISPLSHWISVIPYWSPWICPWRSHEVMSGATPEKLRCHTCFVVHITMPSEFPNKQSLSNTVELKSFAMWRSPLSDLILLTSETN